MNTNPDERYSIDNIKRHSWYNHAPLNNLAYESELIVDEVVLKQLENYGIDLETARENLNKNKHNNMTTTYFLCKKKGDDRPSLSTSFTRPHRNDEFVRSQEKKPFESTGGSSSKDNDVIYKGNILRSYFRHTRAENSSSVTRGRPSVYMSSASPHSPKEQRSSSINSARQPAIPLIPRVPMNQKPSISPRPIRNGRTYVINKTNRLKTPYDIYSHNASTKQSPRAGTALHIEHSTRMEANDFSFRMN